MRVVRQVDKTTWQCTACGKRIHIPRGKRPFAFLVTAPGMQRRRIITVDGEIVHQCLPDFAESLEELRGSN